MAGWTGTKDAPAEGAPARGSCPGGGSSSAGSPAGLTSSHSFTANPFALRFPVRSTSEPFSSFPETQGWLNHVALTESLSSPTFTPTMVRLPRRNGRGGLPITVTRTVPVSPFSSDPSRRI